ncbi:hypothetical protein HLB44_20205 [Aquincola sp. S2]|uniref:Uncharacterized protein n=1 Tax=Pseudaquabacterium terrae TaxID=2732868 RepID=A0ABX2EL82_9BURK|nr:hypothetical protein [Aquabacterium terrae]NRF69325.1 hypothetical protein [Aquabacterium terrae]
MQFPSTLARLVAITSLAVLSACGGGERPAADSPGAAEPADARRRALFTISDDLLNEALAVTLLPYIEQNYASLFPGPQPTQVLSPYVYRCYPGTGNCVGFTANDIYVRGPAVGNLIEPVRVSSVADYCNAHPAACGLKLQRQAVIGGLIRHYIVYLPWRARGLTHTPTVFMLHGTTGTGEEFYNHSGWREKADAEGLIAVFPTALRHCLYEDDNANGVFDHPAERRTPTKWADAFLGEPSERPLCTAEQRATLPADVLAAVDHPLADDVAFFRAMVTDLTTSFAADTRRIYVSGFSNGGQMALRLAHEASDLLAAAASNGGGAQARLSGAAARPMSMIYAIGDRDDRYNASAENPLPLTDVGASPRFQHMTQPFTGVLSLADSYTWQQVTLYGHLMSVYQHSTSTAVPAGGNTLFTAVIQGLDHHYPNYMPDLLWNFFRDKSLP